MMNIRPYLFFEGRCEEAIEFYRGATGAELNGLMRYKDAPADGGSMVPPDGADKVMHASLKIGKSEVLMSDGRCSGRPQFSGASLALSVVDEAAARTVFSALSEGGQVIAPLAKTFFSPSFGMLTDRFGLMWMVMVEVQ
jgi:PhnB protein